MVALPGGRLAWLVDPAEAAGDLRLWGGPRGLHDADLRETVARLQDDRATDRWRAMRLRESQRIDGRWMARRGFVWLDWRGVEQAREMIDADWLPYGEAADWPIRTPKPTTAADRQRRAA